MVREILSSKSAPGLRRGAVVGQHEFGPARSFVYLLVDWKAREAAVVDVQPDLSPLLDALVIHELKVTRLLLTHAHADHADGWAELMRQCGEATMHAHPDELALLAPDARVAASRVRPMTEGDHVRVGGLVVRALHTPGHSPGGLSFLVDHAPPLLFSGDTLFVRECGRTDLPGGDVERMHASLQRLKALPAETVILPGHHYAPECATTLETELRTSPPLLASSVEELRRLQ